MSEPNPPSQPKASGPGNVAGSNPVQFNSAMSAKADQPKDYFAEQNAKRNEKKKKRSKQIKLALIIGIPTSILVVCAVVALVILNFNKPVVTPSEENQQTANSIYDKVMDKVNKVRPALTNPGASTAPSEASVAEADKIFEDAIAEATEIRNVGEADAIRVAQMLFYISVGTDYAKMIEIGEKVENVDALELQQQLQYYNVMANAYAREDNSEKAAEYYAEASRIAGILNGGQEEGA